MSEERDPLDRYFTPDAWADAVVSRWAAAGQIARLRCVVEPSVGQRSVWPRALRRAGYTGRIVGVDVDPDVSGAECDHLVRGDWCEVGAEVLRAERPDLIVGNPPYGVLDAHALVMLGAACPVSILVRTGWLQSARVRDVFDVRRPARLLLSSGRLAFDSPGKARTTTDRFDYCQVSWGTTHATQTLTDWLDWKPKEGK